MTRDVKIGGRRRVVSAPSGNRTQSLRVLAALIPHSRHTYCRYTQGGPGIRMPDRGLGGGVGLRGLKRIY